jgi:glucose/arabinose dehydrogenase/PKD repeat protein
MLSVTPGPAGLRAADAATGLPAGFTDTPVFTGLDLPTNVAFAPDGSVFVTEKKGTVKVFDSLTDTTARVFADLRTNTHNWLDRGMTGLTVHPNWPASPYVYVAYTYDAPTGQTAPVWGTAGADFDDCVNHPDGYCLTRGRVSRLVASGGTMSAEVPILEGWCQPTYNHTVDEVRFGPDGYLYASGGDGATASPTDYGQNANPCGDPPSAIGQDLTLPTAEGGALRSQDLRTAGDPVGLNGTVVRVDPMTGAPAPGNPMAASADVNARRIIAYGLRNPFRFTFRPGTNELWIGDVGWRTYEEINRIPNPTDAVVENFGWPCYEGPNRQSGWDAFDVDICEDLYAAGTPARTAPQYSYRHNLQTVAGGQCPAGDQGSITGPLFYPSGPFPSSYDGAMFFADYARECIFVMRPGTNGLPDPATLTEFAVASGAPVDLELGPDGNLYYVDIIGGSVRRISYGSGNGSPVARVEANPTTGPSPLTVQFDARTSSDPDGDPLTFAWDLDGDGSFDDGTGSTTSRTYPAGAVQVRVRATDPSNAWSTASVTINSGVAGPTATILTPTAGTTWSVGDTISYSGKGTFDGEDLPPSALQWEVLLNHCPQPESCHAHPFTGASGVASGSFVAPDHEYYAYLELRLTATSGGASTSATVRLDPNLVDLTMLSSPGGIPLGLNAESATAPYTRPVLQGSKNVVGAPPVAVLDEVPHSFSAWSDGGSASHEIVVSTTRSLTATYVPDTFALGVNLGGPATTISGRPWIAGTSSRITHNGKTLVNTTTPLQPPTDAARTAMIRSSVYLASGLNVAISAVPNATYDVFVTDWEDNFDVTFDLLLEGATVERATSTGPAGSWRRRGPYRVTVTDGILNVATRGGKAANLSGVELWQVPVATPTFELAVNMNGPATTIDGRSWLSGLSSRVTHNGKTLDNPPVTLSPATDPTRQEMIRRSVHLAKGLQIAVSAVPSGTYDLYVWDWEDNASITFNLLAEGGTLATGLQSGPAGSWRRRGPYRINVTDGVLNVATTGGYAANISGLELWRL